MKEKPQMAVGCLGHEGHGKTELFAALYTVSAVNYYSGDKRVMLDCSETKGLRMDGPPGSSPVRFM